VNIKTILVAICLLLPLSAYASSTDDHNMSYEALTNQLNPDDGQYLKTESLADGVIKVTLNMGDDIEQFFYKDSTDHTKSLERILKILAQSAHGYQVDITVYTNEKKSEAYNNRITEDRAIIANWILQRYGMKSPIRYHGGGYLKSDDGSSMVMLFKPLPEIVLDTVNTAATKN